MALENFLVNSIIIPMDTTYQNNGMFTAYGLVYYLLTNGFPVKWAIQPGKPFDGTDFTATTKDYATNNPLGSVNYPGGPFIIPSTYFATVSPLVTAWRVLHPEVTVHVATAPFSAQIAATLGRAPRIAIEETNSSIMTNYLNTAAIPDSLGNAWTNASPSIFDSTEIGNGAFFGFSMLPCRRIAYDIFLSPHTGDSNWTSPALQLELKNYLQYGGMLHATCHSISSIENTVGPFLTQFGMPFADKNGGTNNSFVVDIPDFPSAQAVSTGQSQNLPGGSEQTWFTGEVTYNAQTQILAHFTESGKQYDFMIAGPYKNGAGAGKIVYEGGHNYDPDPPYTGDDLNLYARFVYDSVFFSVAKPLLYLQYSPSTLYNGIINTVTFSIVNTGGSPAQNATFSVTLGTGMTYNNDATIPPSSVVGQVLTWNSVTLGTALPGTVLSFTADYNAPGTGQQKLADFSTSFDDTFNESYSIPTYCVGADIQQFDTAQLNLVKSVDKTFAQVGDILTYSTVISNTGVLTANNIFFQDIPPNGTQFVPGSVTIGGAPAPAADPVTGFFIPNIPAGGSTTVTFQVTVINVPTPPQAVNSATVTYRFTNTQGTFDAESTSNEVTTQIENPNLLATKTVNKANAIVGDILTYTFNLTNNGTVLLQAITLVDPPPSGTTFVANSVYVNGVNQPGSDPSVGVNVGTLNVSQTAQITYQVTVTSIPAPPQAANVGTFNYQYRIDPAGSLISGSTITNPAITQILNPGLTPVKTSNRTNAVVGDTVTYTVVITNTGTVASQNTFFMDPDPAGTAFVPGSVIVNATPQLSYNPNVGFNIGTIPIGGNATVSYSVTVTSIPTPNPTPNIATISGQFTIEQGQPPVTRNFSTPPVLLQVETVELTLQKNVDHNNALIGDTLTYTVVVTNTGTVTSTNTQFSDPNPNGTAFVPGTVVVSGTPQPSFNPNIGFNIGNIAPGASVTVVWQVTVTSIPTPNPTNNVATASGTFTVDPGQPPIQRNFSSPPEPTQIETALLQITKIASRSNALIGDIVTYTATVRNTGTVPSQNTMLFDNDPPGTAFVSGSVTVNGTPQALYNPNTGIPLGTIAPGGVVIISWRVTVTAIPVPNPTNNIATISGNFVVDPQFPPVPLSFSSAPVPLEVETAQLNIVKTANRTNAVVGDTVTYTVTVSNTGTVSAVNTQLVDPDPQGTSFVTGSVIVGGTPHGSYNPNLGFTLGTIAPGTSVTVTWQVHVTAVPVPNPTNNIATINANFQVDPNLPPVPLSFASLPVPLEVETLQLTMNKTVNPSYAEVGDTLTYTVEVSNTGTVNSTNTFFKDTLPAGTAFVPGSVIVAGVPQAAYNPNIGFTIGNIPVGGSVTVIWQVTVTSVPTPNPIANIAVSTGQFQVDPQLPPVEADFESNPAETLVQVVALTVTKSVDKTLVQIGDVLNYIVTVTNTGTVTSQNTVLVDPDPAGTTFVTGTVRVNGTLHPADNPNSGITLGTILPGQSITVSWQVNVTSVPTPNPTLNMATADGQFSVNPSLPPVTRSFDSPEVPSKIYLVQLNVVKTADPSTAVVGDTIHFVTTITNSGTITAENTEFTDPDVPGTSFILQSVYINGIQKPNENPNGTILLGNIPPGGSATVEWDVTVTEIPVPNPTENIATIQGTFHIDPSIPPVTQNFESPPVPIKIEKTELKINKSVDKTKAHVGDTLTYTVTVTNVGTIASNNTVFRDTDPPGTKFITGTVTVGAFPRPADNPNTGISLGTLLPGESSTITWKVSVLSIPSPNPTVNIGFAQGTFTIDPQKPPVTKEFESNRVETLITPPNSFKQFDFTGTSCLPVAKPDIERIIDMTTKYEITSSKVIITPESTSYEGQVLSGYKAVIRGILTLVVNYISDTPEQSVHAGHFSIPFSTFVILDKNYNNTFEYEIKITVEDIYTKSINNRCIFYNITMLAETIF